MATTARTFRAFISRLIASATFLVLINYGFCGEYRGIWVDSWHDGFLSKSQVTDLISDVRAANLNSVIVQIRKRGDAYYQSKFEPKATNIIDAAFDPLAELIKQAHDTNAGPRIAVHAWLVAYPVCTGRTPSDPKHPYNLHRDWLTRSHTGDLFDGQNHIFDPGHPEVQSYLCDVAMDAVSNYDVDGLHWDYLHYPGSAWGYHPVSVARFNEQFGRVGQPAKNDPQWSQFRRDQVTALLRRTYLSAIAIKPHIKVSVATLAYHPGVDSIDQFTRTRTYNDCFQDWRSWMEEGILDIHVPMIYYRQQVPEYVTSFDKWSQFAKDHKYGRHLVIAPGLWFNSISNSIVQIRKTRTLTQNGNKADGIFAFSHWRFTSDNASRADLWRAFTKSTKEDDNALPIFAEYVAEPEMLWKTKPQKGHLMGHVHGNNKTNSLAGARVKVIGDTQKTLISDATGFYGAVDLSLGKYTLITSFPGFSSATNVIEVSNGKVSSVNTLLNIERE